MQPLTFAALTGHKVITGLWDEGDPGAATPEQNGIDHIAEAQWADALVVAPATANILAKFAHGIADDFLSTLYLATAAPVVVAPAMNVNMWNHPATQANIETLRQRGVTILFVSHAVADVKAIGDRVMWLDHGRLIMDGKLREVIDAYEGRRPRPQN